MTLIEALRKSFSYSFLDDLVENGADRLDRFPDRLELEERPRGVWIGNCSIKAGTVVGIDSEYVYVRRKNRGPAVRICIDTLKRNPEERMGTVIGSVRPFLLKELKVGFGHVVDQVLLARGDRQVT